MSCLTSAVHQTGGRSNNSPSQQALVDVHYYADVTDDFYRDVLAFDWVRAGGMPMRMTAHFGPVVPGFNNAFWWGFGAAFGDGDQVTFRELTSLDVVAHELTHGTTDFTSDLEYRQESGALNEAFSDIMAAAAEFYAAENNREPDASLTPDFLVGEDFHLTPDSEPGIRNMGDPEEDEDPDHYSEKLPPDNIDNGYVHVNSGIPNHAFYLLSEGGKNASCAAPLTHNSLHCNLLDTSQVTGLGIDIASQIFFKGLAALPETSGFCEARASTIAVASQISASAVASTEEAWDQVGVTADVCLTPYVPLKLHIGDLDGTMVPQSGRTSEVAVTVTVHDEDEGPVSGATVQFSVFGFSGDRWCRTDATGTCSISGTTTRNQITFSIGGVQHVRVYSSADNHDPDGDSNGTSISLKR